MKITKDNKKTTNTSWLILEKQDQCVFLAFRIRISKFLYETEPLSTHNEVLLQ
jgi:hypothetical protein